MDVLRIETTTHCCFQAMMVKDLRSKRLAAEIPATLLAVKARVNRSRLSNLERGYAQPTEDELQRLNSALDQLIRAKSVIDRAAASVGWPTEARHD
jgi:transcriptional regulator with XRE-family HTH domain